VYAEDPVMMLPSVGRVELFAPPTGPGVRNDVGLASGDEIGVHYDPMLAKLIVSAPTRDAAIRRLQRALADYAVLGVTTNIPLLRAIVAHPAFAAGDTTTDFLQTYAVTDKLRDAPKIPDVVLYAAAVSDLMTNDQADPWVSPWRVGGTTRRLAYRLGDDQRVLHASQQGPQNWHLSENAIAADVQVVAIRDNIMTLRIDHEQQRLAVARQYDGLLVGWQGSSYRIQRSQPLSVDTAAGDGGGSGHTSLEAPMPGTIIKVLVHPGDEVSANQPLIVMEAMKMEHTIVAPYAGIVSGVAFAAGQLVTGGATLIELDTEA
jgi:3-methylcrotonyl-CoA carboxylase alpha subunit